MAAQHQSWAFACGILGNVISFMVYLAPVPTFYRIIICKKKSTQGFQQAVSYVMALFSAMLGIYYAVLIMTNNNSFLLITINGFGLFIHTLYIAVFLFFVANSKARISVLKLILSLNVVAYSVIVALTLLLLKGSERVTVVGMINLVFSLSMSIIRRVLRTRSVELMPSPLITLSAIAWFFYGLLINDRFVAVPNLVDLGFGVAQMVIYAIYRDAKPALCDLKENPVKATCAQCHKQPELVITIHDEHDRGGIETQQDGHEEGDAGRQSPHGDMTTDGGEGGVPPVAGPYDGMLCIEPDAWY